MQAATHVLFADLIGVPPVWEPIPPPPPPAPRSVAEVAGAAAGNVMQIPNMVFGGAGGIDMGDMMKRMAEMMASQGGSGAPGQAQGSAGKGPPSEQQQQKQKKNHEQKQKQKQKQKKKREPLEKNKESQSAASQKKEKAERQTAKEKRSPKPAQKKKPALRECWVEDASGSHTCRSDSDCGVDGVTCKQRVCSDFGFCTDAAE